MHHGLYLHLRRLQRHGHIHWIDGRPQLLWLIIPGQGDLAEGVLLGPDAGHQSRRPRLHPRPWPPPPCHCPLGLSLAPTGQPQHATVTAPDILGGASATASWVVRGDTEGSYDITASYAGRLEPFGTTVAMQAAQPTEPLHVWGGSALEMTVDADKAVYDRYPYRVRIGLTNKADVPIYNATVEFLKDGKVNYIYQPTRHWSRALRPSPQATPSGPMTTFSPPKSPESLNLARSFVKKTAGDVEPPTKIVSHQPLQTPSTAPVLHAFRLANGVGLLWDPVAGPPPTRSIARPTGRRTSPPHP